MFLDYLIKDLWLDWNWEKDNKSKSEKLEINLNWEKVIFIKPQTFMNLSWESVLKTMSFYKIKKEDIIVIYDDISMDFWKIRYREKGSAGGQNWIKDIISKIWDEFPRIKIWIWVDRRFDTSAWVLSKFTSIELHELDTKIFEEVKKLILEKRY